MNDPTSLYRFYDEFGNLLYVGITKSLPTRLGQHNSDKSWWQYVADIKVEHFKHRSWAREAELNAIRDESPAFNIADRSEDDPPWGIKTWTRDSSRRWGLRKGLDQHAIVAALEPDPGTQIYLRWHVHHLADLIETYWREDAA